MYQYIIQTSKLVVFVGISLTMIACGSNPVRHADDLPIPSENIESLLKRADQSESTKRHPLLVQAAGLLLSENRPNKGLELLRHIDPRYLTQAQIDNYHLFYGEALLLSDASTDVKLEEKHQASLTQLLTIKNTKSHSIPWQIRYFQSLSDSYLANNNYLESAKQRIMINDLIDQQHLLQENNEKIWFAINQMSSEFLYQMISDFNSKRVNGWLEIVYINKEWGTQPDVLLMKTEQWKHRYPLHPANVTQPKLLKRVSLIENFQPKKIAILLPLSGRFAKSGKLVHDGVLAAHFSQQNTLDKPTIQFYDTNKLASGTASYQKAIDDGADFVIGPLEKKSINELINLDTLAAPTLFLNTASVETNRHQSAYQFVLSVEDESIQAAHRAWENGFRKGAAFVPQSSRGKRATDAFKQYFEQLGGELVEIEEYKDIKKLKSNVQKLLHVDTSLKRKSDIENILGRNIEFELRRRQDIDFIFMVSQPKEARRIKPFINFYFALDLPIISTSRIYSGRPNPQVDNELNGIEFSDIPLYISQQQDIQATRGFLKDIDKDILKDNNGRLFSLGFDAYQVLSQLPKLKAFSDYRWYGLSGEIGVDEQGLVHRYLTWAKFVKGVPQPTKERAPPTKPNELTMSALPYSSPSDTGH